METLTIETSEGYKVVTPASLNSLTTYVLLEQETWFEKELPFLRHVLRPGMTTIDIGANLGIFSLEMTRLVGPQGRVFAYEPASEPRGLLEQSRKLNGLDNLEIIPAALSDSEREGRIVFGTSSELNALGDEGEGEQVHITSLDLEVQRNGWSEVDFVKIDAEGEEERVLAGGKEFFARQSPLVQFEINAGVTLNKGLHDTFKRFGYEVYRLLPDTPVLVPAADLASLDVETELNLFAAKTDRVAKLVSQGVFVTELEAWEPGGSQDEQGLALLATQPCGKLQQASGINFGAALEPNYRRVLDAYAAWRDTDRNWQKRCAALAFAFQTLKRLCEKAYTPSRLATLARIGFEFGYRRDAAEALNLSLDALRKGAVQLQEPFWPALARLDAVAPAGQIGTWYAVGCAEQFQRSAGFTSFFSKSQSQLNWLSKQPLASIEMERRRVLSLARAGENPVVTPRLCEKSADHLNAEIWHAGKVPGARLP